jgi:hypothetical protein
VGTDASLVWAVTLTLERFASSTDLPAVKQFGTKKSEASFRSVSKYLFY